MYLSMDALEDGEIRVHVLTDKFASRLRVACTALPATPPESRFILRKGIDAPERLYAGFSWQRAGNDYRQERARATALLDWLTDYLIPALTP
jgi:hypothetical protein